MDNRSSPVPRHYGQQADNGPSPVPSIRDNGPNPVPECTIAFPSGTCRCWNSFVGGRHDFQQGKRLQRRARVCVHAREGARGRAGGLLGTTGLAQSSAPWRTVVRVPWRTTACASARASVWGLGPQASFCQQPQTATACVMNVHVQPTTRIAAPPPAANHGQRA